MTEQPLQQSKNDLKKMKKSRVFRVNFFFFIIFLLFVLLIIKLGYVQLIEGESYAKEVNRTERQISSFPAPRGKMYDRYGRVIVDNEGIPAIMFTQDGKTDAEDKIKTAKKLGEIIEFNYSEEEWEKQLKDRDYKDYWIAAHLKEAEKLVSDKEAKGLENGEVYQLQVNRVKEKDWKAIKADEKERELALLYKRFSGYRYQPQIVKTKAEAKTEKEKEQFEKELAEVSEKLEELEGIDIASDWKRSYPYEDTFRTILGSVTDNGILEEREDFYLARDYSRADRVGKSQLEYQYEEYLHPEKRTYEYITDRDGNTIEKRLVDEGRRGYDLVTTVDILFQQKVDEILLKNLKAARASGNYNVDRLYAVVMDPNDGSVLAMSGVYYNKESGEYEDRSFGTFTEQFEYGSAVKGATVLAGYQEGLKINTTFIDKKLYFAGNVEKASYNRGGLGAVNDLVALQKSSNVYMYHIGLLYLGKTYYPNMPLPKDQTALQNFRNAFSQFGLGVKTGIDLPYESNGLQNDIVDSGNFLDLTIGQFDTYTPLQMAQYVSTIANGGYRIKPQLVKSIHHSHTDKTIGPVVTQNSKKIISKVNNNEIEIDRVQTGFKRVVSSGTAAGKFEGYDVAGKTGTAQKAIGSGKVNSTFVGYFPSNDPEISFSVIVPDQNSKGGGDFNKIISKEIVKLYDDLQKDYQEEGMLGANMKIGEDSEEGNQSEGEQEEEETNQ
ncbi:penicillin-binding protein 2 [Bacillus carboniphilus]|uniref:serine-type D-Ala-D-Ala carboxypeptidase n=1 Tax=Bacillus carboniphilus TaxID=86663 RepID=A0ABY9JUU0_9BACI|nr:penicillin-binding protein 2 [Bacillus carboniphilus]WLR43176.1 penicillin-binding protein 2 [Bacillus carboniphilus]